MGRIWLRCLALAYAAYMTPAYAATTFSTVGSVNETAGAWGYEEGIADTWGQTFVADQYHDQLSQVMFEIANNDPTNPIYFNAYVYAWDGSEITGSALFTSTVQTVPANTFYQPYAINTGDLSLTDGDTYIVFYSTLDYYSANPGVVPSLGGSFELAPQSAYPAGSFEESYAFPPYDGPLGTPYWGLNDSRSWNPFGNGGEDMAFTFTFDNTTPEPGTAGLTGILLLGGLVIRRIRA